MIKFYGKTIRKGSHGPLLIFGNGRVLAGDFHATASVLFREGTEQIRSSTLSVPKQLRTKCILELNDPPARDMRKAAKCDIIMQLPAEAAATFGFRPFSTIYLFLQEINVDVLIL